jgi:hypothetical protein
MTNDMANYQTVVMSLLDELRQPVPARAVLQSCVEYLRNKPLPMDEIQVPANMEWGHA